MQACINQLHFTPGLTAFNLRILASRIQTNILKVFRNKTSLFFVTLVTSRDIKSDSVNNS